jgi:hypothetical protein
MGAKLLTSLGQTNIQSKEANQIAKKEEQTLANIVEKQMWVLVTCSQYGGHDTQKQVQM